MVLRTRRWRDLPILDFKASGDPVRKSDWAFIGECDTTLPQQDVKGDQVKNGVFPLGGANWRLTSDLSPDAVA